MLEIAPDSRFWRSAIVRNEDDKGIIENAPLFQKFHQTSDLIVRVLEVARIRFHESCEYRLLHFAQIRPSRIAWVARRQLRVRWDQSNFELLAKSTLAHRIPTVVEHPRVLRDVALGNLNRRMHRPEGQVMKERFVRTLD